MLGVEGTGGQEDNESGAWKCHIGYAQKTELGQMVQSLECWEVRLLVYRQLGAMAIFKQKTVLEAPE